MITFNHNGSFGDIIYSLPTVISLGGGVLLLKKQLHYDFLRELLELQPYLEAVELRKGTHKITYNLDGFRNLSIIDLSKHLALCHLQVFRVKFDLSKSWLEGVEKKGLAPIVVNRTLHHHDRKEVNYNLLKPYKDKILFVGYEREHKRFEKDFFNTAYFHCADNALELAQIIKGSQLFIGNQSLCFALAEAMKVPRVLEVYHARNNCQPQSSSGYTTLSDDLVRRYLDDNIT